MRLQLALCISLAGSAAFAQTPPTATEAFNLRIKCKDMVDEKSQVMTQDFYRLKVKAPELDFFYFTSRYDPRINRCYGEFHWKQKYRTGPMKEREARVLYDMQIDDLIATWEIKDSKRYGMVYDQSHKKTTDANSGWDDSSNFINEMIEDKK
jgi:hypothetical protein